MPDEKLYQVPFVPADISIARHHVEIIVVDSADKIILSPTC